MRASSMAADRQRDYQIRIVTCQQSRPSAAEVHGVKIPDRPVVLPRRRRRSSSARQADDNTQARISALRWRQDLNNSFIRVTRIGLDGHAPGRRRLIALRKRFGGIGPVTAGCPWASAALCAAMPYRNAVAARSR